MTALGKYLLTSLLFVFAAMMEFAGVLLLRRRRSSNQNITAKINKNKVAHYFGVMELNDSMEQIQGNTPDGFQVNKEEPSLVNRPVVGYETDSVKEEPILYAHAVNECELKKSDAMDATSNVCLSTTKIDALASMVYFVAFCVFNIIFILVFYKKNEIALEEPQGTDILCACDYIDGGTNPAWLQLSKFTKERCHQ